MNPVPAPPKAHGRLFTIYGLEIMTETSDANRVESARIIFERCATKLWFTNVIRLILFGQGSQKHIGINYKTM